MADQRIKAREKTVSKMTRDGLIEESLSSGTSIHVSKRAREGLFVWEGDISTDTGTSRQPQDVPDDRRKLHAEKEPTSFAEQTSTGGVNRPRLNKNKRKTERTKNDAFGLYE